METDIERLQREIFSIDTEAGYRFRHIMRKQAALGCEMNHITSRYSSDILASAFIWSTTSERGLYWLKIYNFLYEKESHKRENFRIGA